MRFAARHPAPLAIVLAACGAVVAVLAFARPEYRPRYESKMIDFATVQYYSPETVRRAFEGEGVDLRFSTRSFGITTFSNRRRPFTADQLMVVVGPRTGTGSFGPELEAYDERFGNVLVTYGGRDELLLDRVENAVASLR
jgi:hypothetical protein